MKDSHTDKYTQHTEKNTGYNIAFLYFHIYYSLLDFFLIIIVYINNIKLSIDCMKIISICLFYKKIPCIFRHIVLVNRLIFLCIYFTDTV